MTGFYGQVNKQRNECNEEEQMAATDHVVHNEPARRNIPRTGKKPQK